MFLLKYNSFILCWGDGFVYVFFGDYLTPITDGLTPTHPIAVIALYLPSVAGLIMFFALAGLMVSGESYQS